MMPILVFVLFACNQRMLNVPYESASSHRFTNICETKDNFSYVFFIGFQVMAILTYFPVFYYLVTSFMLFQTYFLIKAMV